MAIGKRIEETLTTLGWERADLMAKIPTLTPQALSNLIRRDSKRSEWDEEIAKALGVSVLWLVYGQEHIYEHPKVRGFPAREPDPLPDPIGKIVSTLHSMSRDGQLVALGRVEELAKKYPVSKANLSNS